MIDSPALQINKALEACTLAGVGIVSGAAQMGGLPLYENGTNSDGGGNSSNALTVIQMDIILEASECWMGVDDQKSQQLLDQYNKMAEKLNEELAQKAAQEACARMKRAQQIANANSQGTGANPIPTIGGEDFPQNTPITININGGLFTGSFVGNNFYVTSSVHPENETAAQQAASDSTDPCPPPPAKAQDYDYKMDVPCGCGDFFNECQLRRQGWVITTSGGASRSASSSSVMQQFWADPGSKIVMESDSPLTYVVSIVPGRVLAVKAFKQFQGPRTLCLVPPDYYTVQTVRYGTITAVQVVMKKPLSYYTTDGTNDGWSDEVYVTFQSTIGPDIIDILTYIIDNYTDLGWDEESFEYVRTKLSRFPANFPLLDAQEHNRRAQRHRLPVPLCDLAAGGHLLLEVPARRAGLFRHASVGHGQEPRERHDHAKRHRRRAGRGRGTDGHGRPGDEDEGHLADQQCAGQRVHTRQGPEPEVHDPTAQHRPLRRAGAGLRLVHLQPTGHHPQVRDVLADSAVEHVEASQVPHVPQQTEPGDVRHGAVRRSCQ